MLLVVPLVAVVVILAAAWRWGGIRTARLESDEEVHAVLAQEHPEWHATEVARALDARTALACAPPDASVAIVFAHGDVLTSRLLHAGDLAAVHAEQDVLAGRATRMGDGAPAPDHAVTDNGTDTTPSRPIVRARLRLHDVGCPRMSLALPQDAWETWAPRLQRLVGVGLLSVSLLAAIPVAALSSVGRPVVVHPAVGDSTAARPLAKRSDEARRAVAQRGADRRALAGRVARLGRHPVLAPCDERFRASWSPEAPRPGTLFSVQLTVVPVADAPAAAAAPASGANDGAGREGAPGARVGSEQLHFRPLGSPVSQGAGDGAVAPASSADGATASWGALAAVSIDAERSIALRIACPDGSGDSATIRIPLAAASYPMERLRVAPRFSAPPDSALSARMAREAERAAMVSRTSHETPRLWRQSFLRPRESRVTSAFGHGRVFNGSVTSRHMGTDYAGVTGAPVHAANRGVVRLVDEFYLGGNVVYLDHGDGLVTAYLHLSRQLVAEGDTVERGARIGLVGATGRVTGPHLHWIARYGRISVDPASLLRVTETDGGTPTPSGRPRARP